MLKFQSYLSLSILFYTLTGVFIILTFVIPLLDHNNSKANSFTKSYLQIENMEYWGDSPGKLSSQYSHKFTFFDLKTNFDESNPFTSSDSIQVNQVENPVTISEKFKSIYFNFSDETNTAGYQKNRTYTYDFPNSNISTINPAILETWMSLTNVPITYSAISAIRTIADFFKQDIITRAFSSFLYNYMLNDKENTIKIILTGLSNAEQIYDHPTYGLNSEKTIYHWAKVIANSADAVNIAETWPKTELNLTSSQFQAIIGNNVNNNPSILGDLCFIFLSDTATKYNVPQIDDELMAVSQMLNKNALNELLFNLPLITDFKSFYETYSKTKYPFDIAVEMNSVYEGIQAPKIFPIGNMVTNKTFEIYAMDHSNMIKFYTAFSNMDLFQAFNYFTIDNYPDLGNVGKYFFDFLPSLLLRNLKTDTGVDASADIYERAFCVLTEISFKAGINYLLDTHFTQFLIGSYMLKSNTFDCTKSLSNPSLKTTISQESTKKICDDFNKIDNIIDWQLSVKNSDLKAKMITNYGITDQQFNTIISQFTPAFNNALSDISKLYNYVEDPKMNPHEYFALLQWGSSGITNSPLATNFGFKPSPTINSWNSNYFKNIYEFSYYSPENPLPLNVASAFYNDNTPLTLLSQYDMQVIVATLHQNLKVTTDIYDRYSIKKPELFLESLKSYVKNMHFSDTIKELSLNSIMMGGYSDQNFDVMKLGKYTNYFNSYLTKTSPLIYPYGINDYLLVSTGALKENIINKMLSINKVSVLNFYSEINDLEGLVQDYIPSNFNINLTNYYVNDGNQVYYNADQFLYMDQISKIPFPFKKDGLSSYKGKQCQKYGLDYQSLLTERWNKKNSLYTSSFEMLKRPYVVSNLNILSKLDSTYNKIVDQNNNPLSLGDSNSFICVDKFSDYTLNSNIELLFSISTDKLDLILPNLPQKAIIPLFKYQRTLDIDSTEFLDSSQIYQKWFNRARAFIIVLSILLIIFFILAITFTVFYCRNRKQLANLSISTEKFI